MTQAWHHVAARMFAAAAVCVSCAGTPALDAMAQQPAKEAPRKAKSAPKQPSEGAPAKVDLVTAQRFVETGITHLEAGRLDAAVSALSSGLAAGSLPAPQTARALHYRGVAFRRQGKPAQALSDLTSALSVRNGLSDAQRSEALRERAAAYRDAGLPDQSEADSVRAAKGPVTPDVKVPNSTTTATATARTDAAPTSSSSGGGLFGSWFGGGASKAEAAPAPPPSAPPVARTAPPPSPAQTAAAWSSNVEVRPAAPAPEPKARSEVRTASVARPPPPAREPKATKSAKTTPAPKGNLRVQVALLRNRAEAEGLASRIQQKHASALAGRQASIDEVVMGNMGTFYRLRLGPYADAGEPRALCASLKGDGLHCGAVSP